MKKNLPIYTYGTIIILEGIFLLFSVDITFNIIKLTTGFSLTAGAIIAFIAAFSRQKKQVQFAYHQLHALAMLAYGISIMIFCESLEKFVYYSTFLFFYYTFSEIIFCNWLFNLRQKIVYKIIIVRFLLGLVIGIGTVIATTFSAYSIEVFGVLFIIVGINIMFYVPVLRQKELSEVQDVTKSL